MSYGLRSAGGIGYSVLVSTAPTEALIEASTLASHLRLGSLTTEYDLLDLYIEAATGALQDELGISLLTQTLELRLDCFPAYEIRLPRATPGRDVASIQSVTSVTYLDSEGASQTLATSEYVVDSYRKPQARIVVAESAVWPITDGQPNAVTVTYEAGHDAPDTVPAELRSAVLLAAGDLYEHREKSAAQAIVDLGLYGMLVGNYRTYEEVMFR